jgi:hypothetical protein
MISPSRRENGPNKDKNSSRRYQVMLKSMQLLPNAKVTPATFANYFSDVKGKRKANDAPEDNHPTKKLAADNAYYEGQRPGENCGDGNDNDNDLYGEQDMQLTDD